MNTHFSKTAHLTHFQILDILSIALAVPLATNKRPTDLK